MAAVVAVMPVVAPAAERISGDAYSLSGNDLLYHETQYVYDGGSERLVLYRCPAGGGTFARKHVRDRSDAQTPDFELVDARLGYREGAREHGAQREVYVKRSETRPLQSNLIEVPPDAVIDAGFDTFAQRHWDELVRGDTLRFTYLVPSRRTFYDFKLDRVDADPAARTMRLRLSLGTWLSFLLPHVDIEYDLRSREVLRYEGLSNIRGVDGKNFKVRAIYPRIANGLAVPQSEVDAALAEPLVSSCRPDTDARMSATGHPTLPEVTIATAARNRTP